MKFTIKIFPWKNGQGWQEHCIADRTGKTIAEALNELNKLELSRDVDDGMDYSLELYKDTEKIAEFWLSEFVNNGITINKELLRIWRKQIFATAYLVLKDTGLRPGELRALQWSDWYPDLCFFPITKAIESGKRDKIKGTKTGSIKPAVVSEQTAVELERLRSEVKDYSPEKFIFANKKGLPLTIHDIAYNFKAGVKRAGLDSRYSPYWLRHTFNTRMLDILPDEIVRLLMGHETEAMTRHYRHPDIESLKREALKIREIFNKEVI